MEDDELREGKKLPLYMKEMASYSNLNLSQFKYGIYDDNALTYLIRIKHFENFKYVLERGVKPSTSNSDGMNAIHLAVEMERYAFLSFMFLGDFSSFTILNEK